jgi:hypothetical protein
MAETTSDNEKSRLRERSSHLHHSESNQPPALNNPYDDDLGVESAVFQSIADRWTAVKHVAIPQAIRQRTRRSSLVGPTRPVHYRSTSLSALHASVSQIGQDAGDTSLVKKQQHQQNRRNSDWINKQHIEQFQEVSSEEEEEEDSTNTSLTDERPGGSSFFHRYGRKPTTEEAIPLFENSPNENETSSLLQSCCHVFSFLIRWVHYACCASRTARRVRTVVGQGLYEIRWVFGITIPMTITTYLLFYHLGNPSPAFLPGTMTMSWLGNFVSRHAILWSFAQLIQYCVIDLCVAAKRRRHTRSRTRRQQQQQGNKQQQPLVDFGPVLTLLLLQARGWPFVSTAWGILALFLLHGDGGTLLGTCGLRRDQSFTWGFFVQIFRGTGSIGLA